MVGGAKITFGIKPHICQRCSEGANKTLCTQDPGTPQRLSQTSCECLSVSCRDGGMAVATAGMGALPAADLGGAACGLGPRGGDCHHLHHGATEQTTHKLQNNYAKEVLALLQTFQGTQEICQPGDPARGLRTPREFDFGGQWGLSTELPQHWGDRLWGHRQQLVHRTQEGAAATPQSLRQACPGVSRSLGRRRGATVSPAGSGRSTAVLA